MRLEEHFESSSTLQRNELGQRLQSLLAGLSSAVVWATHGRVVVIAAAALRGLGNSPRL
jgi:hypothetical protein